MALANYSIKQPYLLPNYEIPVSNNSVIVNLTLLPGDCLVIVSTYQSLNPSFNGLSFTQVYSNSTGSCYITRNTSTSNIVVTSVSVSGSSSVSNNKVTCQIVRDSNGFIIGNTLTGSGSNQFTLQDSISYDVNTLIALFISVLQPSTSSSPMTNGSMLSCLPPALQSYSNYITASNGSSGAVSVGTFASHNEFVPPSSIMNQLAYFSNTSSNNQTYIASFVSFSPAIIAMDDNTYQIANSPLLNNPNSNFPLYDVEQVDGLSETSIESDSSNVDGVDGSYVTAKFSAGKTIILQGTIYGTTPFDETIVDSIKSNISLSRTSPKPKKFYFKPSQQSPRIIDAYPTSFKADTTKDRNVGKAPFQIQLQSESAFFDGYQRKHLLLPKNTISTILTNNVGNREAYPIIYFTVNGTDQTNPQTTSFISSDTSDDISNVLNNYTVSVRTDRLPGFGAYKLDFKNRILVWLYDGNVYSNAIVLRGWFIIPQNRPTSIRMNRTSSNPDSAVLSYADAWS